MADCACNHFPASLGNVTCDAGVNVGIGTASPLSPLHVAGSIRYNSGSSGAVGLIDNDNHSIRSNGTGAQVFANAWGIATQGWVFRDDATGVDRVTIQSAGNVGIGTTSPAYPLDVAGTIRYTSGASGFVGLVDNDNHTIRSNGAGAQVFANGWGIATQGWIFRDEHAGIDRVVIQSAGNVGIGTTAPAYLLDVNGTAHVSGVLLVGQDVTLNGKLNKSTGGALVDQGGCFYAP